MSNNYNNDFNKYQKQNTSYQGSRQSQKKPVSTPRKKKSPKGAIIVILVAALVVGGIWAVPKISAFMEEKQQEALLAQQTEHLTKGDAYAEKDNARKAAEEYKQAGAEGQKRLEQLYIAETERLISNKKYKEAVTYLTEETEGKYNRDQAEAVIIACARQFNADISAQIQEIITKGGTVKIEYHMYESDLKDLAQWAGTIGSNIPGQPELIKEIPETQGYVHICTKNYYPEWEKLETMWADADTGSLAAKILNTQKGLTEGKISAVEALQEYSKNEAFVKAMISKHLPDMYDAPSEDPESGYSFEDYLKYYTISRQYQYYTTKPADDLLSSFENRETIEAGIAYHGPCRELTEADKQILKENAGQGDKILVLHTRQNFNTGKKTTYVCTDVMDYMPLSAIPVSAEEVGYVIHMDTTFSVYGTYQVGTTAILETTKLTAYEAATGEILHTATQEGEKSDTMYYDGKAPTYYAFRSPVMNEALTKSLKKFG